MNKRLEQDSYIQLLSNDVKQRLIEFLRINGREIANNKTFRCVMSHNHNRNDSDYSASISEDGMTWYCHVCKEGGTIYDLVNKSEGLPLRGSGFIATTLELANRLSIPIDIDRVPEVSSNEMLVYSLSDIYKEIENYLKEHGNGAEYLQSGEYGRSYIKEFAEDACKLVSMGAVDSKDLTLHLRKIFDEKIESLPFYDKNKDLVAPYVFTKDRLVVTISDRTGRPVAFLGRAKDSLCSKDLDRENRKPKYIHTKGFEGIKATTLFLLNKAKDSIKRTHEVQVVEGPFDAISMHLCGQDNTVGIMGSRLHEEALDSLITLSPYTMVFVTDADKAGVRTVKDSLPLLKDYEIVPRVCPIPEGQDPDDLLRSGEITFLDERIDAITYVLMRYHEYRDEGIPAEVRFNKMIEFIVDNCGHPIKYRDYAKLLSNERGYHEEDILQDIQNFRKGGGVISREEKKAMKVIRDAEDKTLMDKIMALEKAEGILKDLAANSREKRISTWQELQNMINSDQPFPTVLDTGIPLLDDHSDIECGSLTFVGGWPSNGKSSFLLFITSHMMKNNPDLYVLFVSTDDQKRKPLTALTSLFTGIPKDEVKNQIINKTFMSHPSVSASLDELKNVFQTQLQLEGLETCYNTATIRNEIEAIRRFHKGPLMVVVDAINNLTDMKRDDQRVALENTITDLKTMAVTYDAAVLPVCHLNKQNTDKPRRPTAKDLKGTSFIEFEAKTIFLVYMDAHQNKQSKLKWRQQGVTLGNSYPVVEINVHKDKDNQAGDIIPLHFNPIMCTFAQPNETQVKTYHKLIYDGDTYGAPENGSISEDL